MRIALVGNPNSGKTTLFNALTGSNQYTGNWPGVTVEKKGGKLKADKGVEITDLPGIYSLSPYTLEEVIARNFLIEERPDAILNIVDSTNLERNLYLTTQLLEMGMPVVVALNMMDQVRKQGDTIDAAELSEKLSCPVVEISALKNEGIDQLISCIKTIPEISAVEALSFAPDVEDSIIAMEKRIAESGNDVPAGLLRFYAIKLLERDEKIIASLADPIDADDIIASIEKKHDDDAESVIINERYQWISSVMDDVREREFEFKETVSDKIDRVVTNRILALPIFVVVMFLVYYLSISTVGTAGTDWINDELFGDGFFLGNGKDQYTEVSEEFEAANSSIEAFEAALAEAGIDTEDEGFLAAAEDEGVTGTYESFDDETGVNEVVEVDAAAYEEALEFVAPYQGDQNIIDAYQAAAVEAGLDPESEEFADEAQAAGLVASVELEDEETGVATTQEIDYEAYAAEVEGSEPDPADYGFWVPSIPAAIESGLTAIDCAPWLQALILDGIVAGVGAVIGFLPQMLVLFFLLAILESCGYMSRVAFILDRVFRRFGLSGKSFIPILIGTGCGVPGVMASRTIENQNDRRMTVMTTTFIPCSAKMPIIALFAAAIFGGVWWVAPSAYFLGLAAILCSGIILKKTRFFAGDPAPFVMELPAYHVPTAGAVLRSMGERGWSFVKKAGTIILLASILIWFLSSYGMVDGALTAVEDQSISLLAVIGGAIAWIFSPLGWGDWQAASAAITGLIAKENVVGTLGILYDGDLGWYTNLQLSYTMLAAYSFMAFNLLCAPCFAAIGAIRREMNSAKWFWAAIGYECGLAYCVSLVIYQVGGLITGEVAFNFFTIVAFALIAAFLFLLFRPMPKKHEGARSTLAVDAA